MSKRFKDKMVSNDEGRSPIAQPVSVQVEVPPGECPDSDSNSEMEVIVEKVAEPESEPMPGPVAAINLGEDVLFSILSNATLDMQDLLNCRLVDRTWWNVATSTLIKRDIVQISLKLRDVPIPSSRDDEARKSLYCHEHNNNLFLDHLVQIISTSPKFPCSSFKFHNLPDSGKYASVGETSIRNFFEACGTHIKTFCVGHLMLNLPLNMNILAQLCNVEFLDIRLYEYFKQDDVDPDSDEDDDGHNHGQGIYPPRGLRIYYRLVAQILLGFIKNNQRLPRLKKIRFDHYFSFEVDSRKTLVEFLQVTAARVEAYEYRPNFLKILRKIRKSDLLKELRFIPSPLSQEDQDPNNLEFTVLAWAQPKLSKLEVNFRHIYENPSSMDSMVKDLNKMLESSKDSLTELHFHVYDLNNQTIKLPRLTKLKCLKLTEPCRDTVSDMAYEHLEAVEQEKDDGEDDEDSQSSNRILQFWQNSSRESFCSLEEVRLDVSNYGHDGCLMLFFHRIRGSDLSIGGYRKKTIVFNKLKGVRSLEMYRKLPTLFEARNFHDIFPCIKHLKLKCVSPKKLSNSLWYMCPSVDSIEIYGMANESRPNSKNNFKFGYYGYDEGTEDSPSILVDSFFTGFPTELCRTFQHSRRCPEPIRSDLDVISFLRTEPSMCDLKYLKHFKIFFTELHDDFASEVSGTYAFKMMPQTKITFVHTAPNELDCSLMYFLKPISSYVTLTHQKMPNRFGGAENAVVLHD